jgi:hypothetical protein
MAPGLPGTSRPAVPADRGAGIHSGRTQRPAKERMNAWLSHWTCFGYTKIAMASIRTPGPRVRYREDWALVLDDVSGGAR